MVRWIEVHGHVCAAVIDAVGLHIADNPEKTDKSRTLQRLFDKAAELRPVERLGLSHAYGGNSALHGVVLAKLQPVLARKGASWAAKLDAAEITRR